MALVDGVDGLHWRRYLTAATVLGDGDLTGSIDRCLATLVPSWIALAAVALQSQTGALDVVASSATESAQANRLVAWVAKHGLHPPEDLREAFLGGRPWLAAASSSGHATALVEALAVTSAIFAPIMFRRRPIGCAIFATATDSATMLAERDLKFAAMLGERLSLTIVEERGWSPFVEIVASEPTTVAPAVDRAISAGEYVALAIADLNANGRSATAAQRVLLDRDRVLWLGPQRLLAITRGALVSETDERLDSWIEQLSRHGRLRGLGYATSLMPGTGHELIERAIQQASTRRHDD